jgi:hypothetical protein
MRARLAGVVVVAAALAFFPACGTGQNMEYGGPEDVGFAASLWSGMEGYHDWPIASEVYAGASPHGAFVRVYYSIVPVNGVPYHVIVKDNFGGEDATLETVTEMPMDHLAAITVMVQREAGYDSENMDWYWVKFDADGSVSANDAGVALAGRVARGADSGCIACHAKAGGSDYFFTND